MKYATIALLLATQSALAAPILTYKDCISALSHALDVQAKMVAAGEIQFEAFSREPEMKDKMTDVLESAYPAWGKYINDVAAFCEEMRATRPK